MYFINQKIDNLVVRNKFSNEKMSLLKSRIHKLGSEILANSKVSNSQMPNELQDFLSKENNLIIFNVPKFKCFFIYFYLLIT